MHAARPERSARLRRVLAVLADGREHSTREIQRRADTVAVAACVSELRTADYHIVCRRTRRADSRPVWLYRCSNPPTALELRAMGA